MQPWLMVKRSPETCYNQVPEQMLSLGVFGALNSPTLQLIIWVLILVLRGHSVAPIGGL